MCFPRAGAPLPVLEFQRKGLPASEILRCDALLAGTVGRLSQGARALSAPAPSAPSPAPVA
eukprot:scaffold247906_cov43-Prasinocladus_malaysianus.AAC.1